jgi:hypothetical protein
VRPIALPWANSSSTNGADELPQFWRPGSGEDVLRNTFFMHLALVHEDKLGADVTGEAHFMGDQNERHAFVGLASNVQWSK